MAGTPLLAFPYGETLTDLNVKVQVTTQTNAAGIVTSVQFSASGTVDPKNFHFVTPNPASGNYPLSQREVGVVSNSNIHDDNAGSDEISVTFDGAAGFLNLKLPLADPKRDLGN